MFESIAELGRSIQASMFAASVAEVSTDEWLKSIMDQIEKLLEAE